MILLSRESGSQEFERKRLFFLLLDRSRVFFVKFPEEIVLRRNNIILGIAFWNRRCDTVMICAQLSDWKKCRKFQGTNRRHSYLQQKTFSDFEDEIRERRRRYKVKGDIRIRSEPGQQSRLKLNFIIIIFSVMKELRRTSMIWEKVEWGSKEIWKCRRRRF